MGTKRNPGAFDCYDNAKPDEPMFILLGRDRHAPQLVRLWADLRKAEGEDAAKVQEALICANMMASWLSDHGKNIADDAVVALRKALIRFLDETPKHSTADCVCPGETKLNTEWCCPRAWLRGQANAALSIKAFSRATGTTTARDRELAHGIIDRLLSYGVAAFESQNARGLVEDVIAATFATERATVEAEREHWKRRAASHGCDVDNGDPDCG